MAKSKTKKTKTKPVDDEDLQVKKADKDEATEVEVDDAEPEEAVEEPEEATELDVDEDADADAEPAEEDAADTELDVDDAPPDDADADEDDDEDSVDEGPVAPPAKITKLAVTLIFFNWVFAQVFLMVAYLDHAERVKYSYRTLLNYVQIYGLPLKSEEDVTDKEGYSPLSIDTRPMLRLTSEQLEDAFKKRPETVKKAITSNTKFVPFEENIVFDGSKLVTYNRVPYKLRPSDMEHSELIRDVFQGVPEPVKTLEGEIERLKGKLPVDIESAAKEVKEAIGKLPEAEKRLFVKKSQAPYTWDSVQAKKMAADIDAAKGPELDALTKRAFVRHILFPIAWNVHQVKKLEDQLMAKDADLDRWLDDAIQRRMYYDILAPINVFRPGDISDVKFYKIEKLADREAIPTVEKLKELLDERLNAAVADKFNPDLHFGPVWNKESNKAEAMQRHSIEKRRNIAFLLFTVSQVTVPAFDSKGQVTMSVLDKKKLYDKGIERAQIVSGLQEFTNASIYYVRTLRVLEERMVESVLADRQGVIAGLKGNTAGYKDEFEAEIDRLTKIVEQIDSAEKRLKDLQLQKGEFQKTYDQRAAQHKAIFDKLLDARKGTAKYIEELREKQDQLHEALIELSEAGDRNFRLYEEIRALELSLMKSPPPKKGGKK